jgi:hypothetical protein
MAADNHGPQLIGSLLVAAIIVIVTIALVTARLGPDGDELLEDRRDRQEEGDDNSGRGSSLDQELLRMLASNGSEARAGLTP